MKKAELAALAAREVAGTGWLPEVLRARDPVPDELHDAASSQSVQRPTVLAARSAFSCF
jgi:hypothetical protein